MEWSELRATLNYRQVSVPRSPDKGGLSVSPEPLVLLSCNKDCPHMQLVYSNSGVMHMILLYLLWVNTVYTYSSQKKNHKTSLSRLCNIGHVSNLYCWQRYLTTPHHKVVNFYKGVKASFCKQIYITLSWPPVHKHDVGSA